LNWYPLRSKLAGASFKEAGSSRTHTPRRKKKRKTRKREKKKKRNKGTRNNVKLLKMLFFSNFGGIEKF
jgi:hypothetical protein